MIFAPLISSSDSILIAWVLSFIFSQAEGVASGARGLRSFSILSLPFRAVLFLPIATASVALLLDAYPSLILFSKFEFELLEEFSY